MRGFRASGISSGIKKNGRKDLALILSDVPARTAALFTTNKVKAAPVLYDMKRVKGGHSVSRGVIVNSGNANACTGAEGYGHARRMAGAAEAAAGTGRGSILVSSTGVIGVPFPIGKVTDGAPSLAAALSPGGLHDAAEAIMTTDAFPKKAVSRSRVNGRLVTVAGIAKGAGMICPDMATMLAYFLTDADITGPALKAALKEAVDGSFNSIIVDNDTSTNDTVIIFANGASGAPVVSSRASGGYGAFVKLLKGVAVELAHMIVRDGEGATRFIEISVTGAASAKDARKAARTIAESFLVKTAFFGGDPNWGRILAAIGRAGIRFNPGKADILLNGVPVVRNGLDTGREKQAARAIKKKEVLVDVGLKGGNGSARVWTTDLSYEYVRINSAYRT
ncbi:MAG: bifunctional glutamate N-acetyltransferase/amino-acid acetyltransferase ArgJ [Deltaproteobacteria bacterium]|nr:bifunctional glutamate N-acetyltransferase/amino-acid acetyltransferase ArgJ [Deltaproteobacteria bacterium]